MNSRWSKNKYEKEPEVIKRFVSEPFSDDTILKNVSELPKISVVTLSFNQARFLENTILSVVNQNYPNLEYIIVDPGSTDGSREIIRRYSNRISHMIFESDNGPADGLNKGFSNATGDILCYLNSDDIFLPDTFQTIVKYFFKMPSADVIYGNGYQLNAEDKFVKKIFSTSWSTKAYAYGACNVIQQATFLKASSFKSMTGFNPTNRTCWDGELLVDLALAGAEFKHIPEFLGGFRIYPDSITGSNRLRQQYISDSKQIFKKIIGKESNDYSMAAYRVFYRFCKYLNNPMATTYKIAHMLRTRMNCS